MFQTLQTNNLQELQTNVLLALHMVQLYTIMFYTRSGNSPTKGSCIIERFQLRQFYNNNFITHTTSKNPHRPIRKLQTALALWLYLESVCSSVYTMFRFIMCNLTNKTKPKKKEGYTHHFQRFPRN